MNILSEVSEIKILMKNVFCKKMNCPSSVDLLDFQRERIVGQKAWEIRNHLSECDFCGSEITLYSRLEKLDEAETEEVPIPLGLLNLAFGLLSRRGLTKE